MSSYDYEGIVTPEGVVLEFEPARLPSRLLAMLLDVLILGTVFGVIGNIFLAGVFAVAPDAGESTLARVLGVLLLFAVAFGYPVIIEVWMKGRSPGKAALGLRTVTVEGLPVRARHSMIRTLLWFVDYPITSGVAGVMSMLLSRNGQRLGDVVAGTVVRRDRASAPYVRSMRFNPPQGYEPYIELLDTSRLTPADELAVRSFVLRAAQLRPQVRTALAMELAPLIASRLAHTPPVNVPPDLFLASVAVASQRRVGVPQAMSVGGGWGEVAPPRPPAPAPTPDRAEHQNLLQTNAPPPPDEKAGDGFAAPS